MYRLKNSNEKPLTKKQYFVVAYILFALFFGAGNLIFPLHLGQLAGSNWIVATLGFLVTAVALPLLSVLAISITKSEGVYDIGKPLGSGFALAFMVLIHTTIGPLFGTLRTATVPFTVGVQPLLPTSWVHNSLLIFSVAFFCLAFLIAYQESNIMNSLGKILNPLFLLLLFSVFLIAFMAPMGKANLQPVTGAYKSAAFFNGSLEGYNTMDALAGLAFGVTVVTAVRQLGKTNPNSNAAVTAKAGVLATGMIGLIYICLIWLGATTLNHFKVSADGGVAFNQDPLVYKFVVGFTTVPALMDMVAAFPPVISQSEFGKVIGAFQQSVLPFSSLGMDWVIPAFIGAVIGLGYHFLKQKSNSNQQDFDQKANIQNNN